VNVIFIGIAAFLGAICSSLLGWCDSQEAFDVRKFAGSVIRAIIAGVIFAVGYNYMNDITPIDIGIAFLGGSGVDCLGNRIAGSIKAGLR